MKLLNETKNCFRDYSDYVDGMAGDSFATVRNVLFGLAWCAISKMLGFWTDLPQRIFLREFFCMLRLKLKASLERRRQNFCH